MACGFILNGSRILPHARPRPIFRPPDQPRLDRIQVDILNFVVIFLHGAQGTVKEPRLPQFAPFTAPAIDEDGRADFDGFHDLRNRERKDGRADGMPVVGKKNPGRQIEWMLPPRPVQGHGEQAEIGITQSAPPLEQSHGDEEITVGKKGTPEPRHGARIQHREQTAPEEPRTSNPEVRATRFDTEFKAYEVGSEVKPYTFFRRGPKGYDQLELFLMSSPAYSNYNNMLVFDPVVYPQ
jgi:hypothetical protein